MLKTSNIKSMAQILRNMKHPPVEEDTDKDEPGTQGDKEEYQRKRKEIAKKFGVESCSALKDEEKRKACYAALDAAHVSDDEEEDEDDDPGGKNEDDDGTESFSLKATMALGDAGIMSRWKKGKLYVARKDIKKAEKALAKSFKHMKKGAEPDLWHEEVELDEAGDKKWHWYNLDRGVYKLEKNNKGMVVGKMQDKKKEVRDGFPNAVEVLSNVKQAAKLVAKKNGFPLRGEEVEGGGTGTGSGIEEVEITEADKKYPPTIETLKMIVKDKQNQVVKFKDGNARVDGYSASAMTQVYDAMKKPDLKKKFEDQLKTKAGFLKIQAFAFSMVK